MTVNEKRGGYYDDEGPKRFASTGLTDAERRNTKARRLADLNGR
jgi:hypothetical protein